MFFTTASAENVCGDWATYKEEKCIKVIDSAGTQSFENAVKTCAAHDGSKLITISNADEQAFLTDLLFTKQHLVDSVWLGAKISSQQSFHWENEKKVTFTNWALGNPKNHSIETCVQMHAEEEVCGKWSNEPCTKMNRVVCEKNQTWSLQTMQGIILKMIKNPVVPLGFIYVQLPQEKAPQEIWPSLIFTDISTQYDSTFFRVAGNKGAAAFGTVQKESLPYIDQVNYYDCQLNAQSRCTVPLTREVKIQLNGGLTGNILTTNGFVGPAPNNHVSYLQFHSVPGEVRPTNMAVKVWKRTA